MNTTNQLGKYLFYDDAVAEGCAYIFDSASLNILSLSSSTDSYSSIKSCLKNNDTATRNKIIQQLNDYFATLPKMFRVDYSNLPSHLQVILPISAKCNLKCPYCFARTEGSFQFGDYSFDELKAVVDYFHCLNDIQSINYAFFGGEPYLKEQLIEDIVTYTKSNYPDDKITFSVTTNGTLLTEKSLDFVKRHNIGLLISIDGPEGGYNHRKFKNGRGSVNVVKQNIERCKEKEINVALRATVTKDYPNFVELFDFFEDIGLSFDVELAYKSGNVESNIADYSTEDIQHVRKEFESLRDYYIDRICNGKPVNNSFLIRSLSQLKYRTSRTKHCSGGINVFSITSNGDVFSCEHLIHDKIYTIGNIHTDGLHDLRSAAQSAKDIDELNDCKGCVLLNLCIGGCFSQKLLSNHRLDGTLSGDDCELEKLKWESIIVLFARLSKKCKQFIESLSEETL